MKELRIHDDAGMTGRVKIRKSVGGKVVWESDWIRNKVMKSDGNGVNIIARQLGGDTLYPLEITHAKIGTGTTPPADGDTDLETPTDMVSTGDPDITRGDQSVNSTNVTHLEFFIPAGDLPNGTYTEWGLFTGVFGVNEQIFARTLITPSYTKATGEDTTVIHEITVSN